MKIFQVVQKNLSYLGISWYDSIQKYPINVRNASAILVLSLFTALACIYLCRVANTFQEYAESVYSCLSLIDATVISACVVWKMRTLFSCLHQIEAIANESEFLIRKFTIKTKTDRNCWIQFLPGLEYAASNVLYTEINSNVEKWCKIIITLIMAVAMPAVVFSRFLFSYYLYYATDFGNDAFQLVFPCW